MATSDEPTIVIHLHCQALPGSTFGDRHNIRLGIQKGKVVIDDVAASVEEVTFRALLRVAQNPETGKPNFLGPYAQGKPAERFLYLCWGERIDGAWEGVGRVKVHLNVIEWPAVAHAIATGEPIAATIQMTNAKGQPLYASVKQEQITWQQLSL